MIILAKTSQKWLKIKSNLTYKWSHYGSKLTKNSHTNMVENYPKWPKIVKNDPKIVKNDPKVVKIWSK